MTVELQVTPQPDGCTLLKISGEIDVAHSERIRTAGADSIRAAGHGRLAIDLSDVTFLDSTGLGALIQLRSLSIESETALVLVDPSPVVRRLLALTCLSDAFEIAGRPSDPTGAPAS